MSIYIQFENGLSPYTRSNMTDNEFTEELELWQEKYTMTPVSVFGTVYSYIAKEKENA